MEGRHVTKQYTVEEFYLYSVVSSDPQNFFSIFVCGDVHVYIIMFVC